MDNGKWDELGGVERGLVFMEGVRGGGVNGGVMWIGGVGWLRWMNIGLGMLGVVRGVMWK